MPLTLSHGRNVHSLVCNSEFILENWEPDNMSFWGHRDEAAQRATHRTPVIWWFCHQRVERIVNVKCVFFFACLGYLLFNRLEEKKWIGWLNDGLLSGITVTYRTIIKTAVESVFLHSLLTVHITFSSRTPLLFCWTTFLHRLNWKVFAVRDGTNFQCVSLHSNKI